MSFGDPRGSGRTVPMVVPTCRVVSWQCFKPIRLFDATLDEIDRGIALLDDEIADRQLLRHHLRSFQKLARLTCAPGTATLREAAAREDEFSSREEAGKKVRRAQGRRSTKASTFTPETAAHVRRIWDEQVMGQRGGSRAGRRASRAQRR